jgi:NitT/TauT family transport system permease protein
VPSVTAITLASGFALLASYGGYRATELLVKLPASAWAQLGIGLGATFLRVAVALAIALLWTIPLGVAIGTNRRLATILQPVVQVVAAIPATALFPVILLALVQAPGGLNLAAVALMLMGTQWYLLFNVIGGAAAIPQDLRDTTELLRLSRLDRWRTLILPALFPYIITGAITASGGAWNASIVAEHVEFGGQTHSTAGVGALIWKATDAGDYPLLVAATLALVISVTVINRTFWRRLYRLAEERYRME